MRKKALTDDILLRVEKPARYIGNEVNSIQKEKEKVDIRVAMCFPDIYEIGMSHLGMQLLYDMFNRWEDTWCERVYSPWSDLDHIMREEGIPLFTLESQEPVRSFDFLGITIQYEMCYTNILQILDLSDIPLLASQRTEDDPIVIGGGPCVFNPEPVADFFDLFYIGEGETRYRELLTCYKNHKRSGAGRAAFLRAAAQIPGIYVPALYTVSYQEDGTIRFMEPVDSEIPFKVRKEIAADLSDTCYPVKPVVPFIKATQDRVTLEILRGCIRGCRFCQAGQIYRPVRERDLSVLKEYALSMLAHTGHEEISLSSLSSSDYTKLPELIDFLIKECQDKHTNISLPSLRIDAFSLDVMSKVQDVKKSSLTFAPEAGSQRLRNVINKGLTGEMILAGAARAFEGGWSRVKLYFMLGLPSETEEDILAIGELANRIAALYYETVPRDKRNGRVQIVVSTSFFIPKPFTPFQWAPQATKEAFLDKAYLTRKSIAGQLNQKSIKYNWHETDASVMECVMARGDRRLGAVILAAYQKGCLFDAWSEYYRHDLWMESMAEQGLSSGFYTTRQRAEDEIFPWDFIDCGVTKEFLLKEWHKSQQFSGTEEAVTPNCREQCQGCGVSRFGAGICHPVPSGKDDCAESPDSDHEYETARTRDIPGTDCMQRVDAVDGEKTDGGERKRIKVRVKFSKIGPMTLVGHLDIMRFFQKAVRRAGIDVAYSGGFSPHQIMSFAAPLGVGVAGYGEYFDMELRSPASAPNIRDALERTMVEGISIVKVTLLSDQTGNAMASVAAASYRIRFREGTKLPDDWKGQLEKFYLQETIPYCKTTKKGIRDLNLKPFIYELKAAKEEVYLLVNASSAGNIKPGYVIEAFFNSIGWELPEYALLISREELYGNQGTEQQPLFVPLSEM